jgi:4-aminobutyrate aminotransferase-like enzyme/Ser/Thr protein kinase RdoA (MazF antagonist)
MSDYKRIKVNTDQAVKIAESLYGLTCEAIALPGESDFNFRLTTNGNEHYLLKVSRPETVISYLDYQCHLLEHLSRDPSYDGPKVLDDQNGKSISNWSDPEGNSRPVRLLSWVEGRMWDDVNPQLPELRISLGDLCGSVTRALEDFDHPGAHRTFRWDIAESLWTRDYLELFAEEDKQILSYFQDLFANQRDTYSVLRKGVVHNDANSHNTLVSNDLTRPRAIALIDYGDAIFTQVVNDVAVACAYAVMGQEDPLDACLSVVAGYHQAYPMTEQELAHLYTCIAMRMVISVTQSAINKQREPDNTYLLISETPAWDALRRWRNTDRHFAHYSFREACGFSAHPDEEQFKTWAKEQECMVTTLFPTAPGPEIYPIDLSVGSSWAGHESDSSDLDLFQFKMERLQSKVPDKLIAGGYLEPRALYGTAAYEKRGNFGMENRTIHLGIDYWLPAGEPVHALFEGEVMTSVNDAGDKEYGGLVVLRHRAGDLEFFSLHGHLDPNSILHLEAGMTVAKGSRIGVLGIYPENGNWAPHLHYQIMLSMLEYETDFPGVAYFRQLEVWKSLCPDPNLLFKSEALMSQGVADQKELLQARQELLGKSLSLQYDIPLHIVRGSGAYLIDSNGRKYLDTVNNVAHVGHEHPEVVRAGQEQMALLNTNSRYLHENCINFAKELLATMPDELEVVHFVNSGSEANELALRMIRTVTGSGEMIVSAHGYHGNSNACVDISSYKFDGKGGSGAPKSTHVIPMPDTFRGKYRGNNANEQYAAEVKNQISLIHREGKKLGGFIIEPILSCGGQVDLPPGFLTSAYTAVREAGGLCISDEVQVGCGRLGSSFWGFQLHGVVPDIVTIGKPLGNGHPVAAVVCTRSVADSFANDMEYFNTFGGNPVSCAIGSSVLKTISDEDLQRNARDTGTFLKNEFERIREEVTMIGDVRGQGLFLGFELVTDQLEPLPEAAHYLVNRMKDYGILMSTDGPDNNVVKIKPPMVFRMNHALELLYYLDLVLKEDYLKQFYVHLNS